MYLLRRPSILSIVLLAFCVAPARCRARPPTAPAPGTAAETDAYSPSTLPSRSLIVGVGFGHTGTESVKRALMALGFRVLHFEQETRQMLVMNIAGGKATGSSDPLPPANASRNFEWGWQQILQKADAIIDLPVNLFYEHALTRFPDARFILTMRDPGPWADSLLAWHPLDDAGRMLPCVHKGNKSAELWGWCDSRFGIDCEQAMLESTFGSPRPSREDLVSAYERHIAAVRQAVPRAQLLEFDVFQGDGYEKLAPFLGLSVPRDGEGAALEFPYHRNSDWACKDPTHEAAVQVTKGVEAIKAAKQVVAEIRAEIARHHG